MARDMRSWNLLSSDNNMDKVIIIVIPYLLGGIPFGYLIGRWLGKTDVRQKGSGNIGAANVLRTIGKSAGAFTLILDILKGAVSVLIAFLLIGRDPFWCGAAGLSAIIGHIFPVYLKFKGGKGFAVTIGSFLILTPFAMLLSIVVFFAVAIPTRIVSIGSISAAIALPVFSFLFQDQRAFFYFTLVAGLLIVLRHAPNIRNLMNGTEPRVGEKKQ